ncbi:MAG: MFS transporter [Nitrososphaerales archaeon]
MYKKKNKEISEGRQALAASLGHFSIEINGNIIPPLIPIFSTTLGITYALAGLLIGAYNLLSTLLQPFFGLLTDKKPEIPLAPMGVILSSLTVSFIGLMDNYSLLVLLSSIAGLGSAMFHPHATSSISFNKSKRRVTALGFFSSLGSIGVALGPLIMVYLYKLFGLKGTLLLASLSLLSIFMIKNWRRIELKNNFLSFRHLLILVRGRVDKLFPIISLDVIRALLFISLVSFLPSYGVYLGMKIDSASTLLFVMLISGGVGNLVGGNLADKFGRKVTLILSFSLTFPLLYVFINSNSIILWIYAALIGFFLLSSLPITIVMGHEILPEHKGFASSLNQGLAWAFASFTLPFIGLSIDIFGFFFTYQLLAFTPLISIIIILIFRLG